MIVRMRTFSAFAKAAIALAFALFVSAPAAVSAQVSITSFAPSEISYLGGTPFQIVGSGFAMPITVRIGIQNAIVVSVTPTMITGFTPASPPSPTPVTLAVTVTGVGVATLPGATTFVGPLDLIEVSPSTVLQGVPTEIRLLGVALTPLTTLTIGGTSVGPVTYVAHDELRVTVSTLPLGMHAIVATAPAGAGPPVVTTLSAPKGLTVLAPLSADTFAPTDASYLGGTPFITDGTSFTANTTVMVGGALCPITFVTPTQLRGAIAVPVGAELGVFYAVTVSDPMFGTDVIRNAVRFMGPLALNSVEPPLVPAQTSSTVIIHGVAFTPSTVVEIDGEPATLSYLDPLRLEVIVPPSDPHLAEVTLTDHEPDGDLVIVRRVAAITIYPVSPATLTSVDPREACLAGGTFVSFYGSGFLPETVIRVNGFPLENSLTQADGTRVSGTVPPGVAAGPALVAAGDFRGVALAPGLLTYVNPCASLRAPEQFETSLAEGSALFTWHNPEPYVAIHVLDADGSVLEVLPGDSTFYELQAPGASQVSRSFRGVGPTLGALSPSVDALAEVHPCNYPPPFDGQVFPGEMDLVVRGQHAAADIDRCSDGGGPILILAPPQFEQPGSAIGYVKPNWARGPAATNHQALVFGFTLENEAELLEFAAYYRKLAFAFGLSLRGHLEHVFPNDGFEDEFTWPDPFPGENKQWHSVTYYRATDDVASADAVPCSSPTGGFRKIPAGEYRLSIYAVGGENELPYYLFGDDPRDVQSLIAGTPCPPYPLVRARNMTGLRTLPNIEMVVVAATGELPNGQVAAALSARGTWFDENGQQFSIDPFCDHELLIQTSINDSGEVCFDPPYLPSTDFDYLWRFDMTEPPISKVDGPLSIITFPDWGCYPLELTVRDKACGVTRKFFQEIALVPDDVTCDPGSPYSFRYPTPDPQAIVAIVNLQNLPTGDFNGVRPLAVRVLVVPQCFCAGASPCPPPQIDDVEFRLAVGVPSGSSYVFQPLAAAIEVTDLCPFVIDGAKYFLLEIEDLGSIPSSSFLDDYEFRPVTLQGRATTGGDSWHNFGSLMAFANSPPALDTAAWSGHYEKSDGSYHFVIQSSPDLEQLYEFPDSDPIGFGIVDAGIPAYTGNSMAAGFTSRLSLQGQQWFVDDASATSSGTLLENDIQGIPQQVTGDTTSASAFGPGLSLPIYEWCQSQNIFNSHFSQTLFESIIWAGAIGPVQVTIWASVGFGVSFSIDSFLESRISPFAPLPSGNLAEIQYTLESEVELSLPCAITADIFGGIASVTLALVPATTFGLVPSIFTSYSAAGAAFNTGHHIYAWLDLDMEAEVCAQTIVFGEQCLPKVIIPLLDMVPLIDDTTVGGVTSAGSCGPGALAAADGGGSGAAPFSGQTVTAYTQASMPFSIVSPNGLVVVDGYAAEEASDRLLKVIIQEQGAAPVTLTTGEPGDAFFYYIDPQAAFIANDHALFVGTAPASGYVPETLPSNPADPNYLPARNRNIAATEVQIAHLVKVGGVWDLVSGGLTEISDLPGTPIGDRLADGRPAVAADLTTGEALVAWVRYADDYLIEDGVKAHYRSTPACPGSFCEVLLPWIRPRMEAMQIAVRRVGAAGLIAGEGISIISEPGINLQPAIAFSPSGARAFCVWVHDPNHVELIDSNLGRFLRCAIYDAATDTWSAPFDVVAIPDEYPGILEPVVALSGDQDGIVAFTALLEGAPERDSGLGGGSRHLYAARLVNGVFQEPFRIRGRCEDREYGFGQTISVAAPTEIEFLPGIFVNPADGYMSWMQYGEVGLDRGSGNVMVSVLSSGVWSPPVAILPTGRIVSNVVTTIAAGALHSVHFDAGPAVPSAGPLGGAAAGYVSLDTPLLPDAAVTACELSHSFPAPGSPVRARVTVENRGLTSTSHTGVEQSLLGVALFFIDSAGSSRLVTSELLPVLAPNEAIEVELALEMPHHPVILLAELTPNPIDSEPANNTLHCYFGAPAPTQLVCEDNETTLADQTAWSVKVKWTNPVVYDAVWVYRDGSMLHELSSGATHFVDFGVSEGLHTYEVRGIIGASKSAKTSADCCVGCPPPVPNFVRANVNGASAVEISDVIYLLNYLFVAGPPPPCLASADINADAFVNIADAVYLLLYLFQSGPLVPAPFPACGPGTTADAALGCETPGC